MGESNAAREELLEKIKGVATDVYTALGSGHHETVYEKAMMVGLRLEHLPYETQRKIPVNYRDHFVGELIPDLIIGKSPFRVIVELKADDKKSLALARQQLKTYMEALEIDCGLLINFFKLRDNGKAAPLVEEFVRGADGKATAAASD